ncbi:unnamed protein product [Penicillium salamii]|uniref:Beta-lactamase-related domain-containing protein n=1 Tax=Penicillium salamii TaxID=1612424 RepID=A0A9W4J7E6_9EURO|nr:unnamed protein product [Penicillium salamii]
MLYSRWLLLLASAHAHGTTVCPLLGPAFPAPTALSKDETFLSATEGLTSKLHKAIDNGDLPSISFALQIFNGQEPNSAFSFYHTDEIIKFGNVGVNEVDENTIFRIGSISKLWTMFLYMTFGGIRHFHEPITKYIPELRANQGSSKSSNAIDQVQWEDVTIGELASHQAGVLNNYGLLDLGSQQNTLQNQGFPELSESEQVPCGNTRPCDRAEFFDGVLERHPLAATSYTPLYSNSGYQILGYALESILGASYEDILLDRLIKPLNLTQSSLNAPNPDLAVIPFNETFSFFNFEFGDAGSVGGIYSSTKDMATFGRAILSNTLIEPAITRRWLKPATHTSSLRSSVGAPWEIYSHSTPRRVDLYSKAGDIGSYSSFLGLSPDHDTGFTILVAGSSNSHQSTAVIADIVADTLLPTLDTVARNQALGRFGGDYELSTGGSNSSIAISADDSPGLHIERWISDSVDMYETLMTLTGVTDASAISIRLQPNGLRSSGRIRFTAVIYTLETPPDAGPISGSCVSWFLVDQFVYGNVGLSDFEFELDDNGYATSISPQALRMTIPRV